MTKRKKFHLIINVILVIIFSLSFVMGKWEENSGTRRKSSKKAKAVPEVHYETSRDSLFYVNLPIH